MPRLSEEKKAVLESMTREALYEAAVSILQEEGWPGLTIEKLAASAGVAKGTVYNYFPDKKEIIYFVAERNMEAVTEKIRSLDLENGDPLALLQDSLDFLLAHMFENRRTLAAMVRVINEDAQMRTLHCDCRNHPGQDIRETFVEIFRKGIATGCFRPCDPLLMDSVLHATLHGIIHEFILHTDEDTDVPGLIPEIRNIILHGLCREEKAKP